MNTSRRLLELVNRSGQSGGFESLELALEASQAVLIGSEGGVAGAGLLLVALLGLAMDEGPTDALSELADRVKRLADGDDDVEFPTDRDDDIGRLADALDGLAEQVRQDRKSTHRYSEYTAEVLDALDDVFYMLDEEGNVLQWNESLADVTGYTGEEIDSMHALGFFDESESDRIAAAMETVFETGEVRVETELLAKDGRSIPYEFFATRLEDPDSNIVLAGIGRDISERRAHERKLRERERELSTLMDNIPGMVYRAGNDPDWPFEFVSEGCRDVTGYEPEALENGDVNWGEEVIAESNDGLWETVQQAVDAKESYQVTFQIETADGDTRWVWEQGRGVFDEDGSLEALEGVILDITDQKERETALERTMDFLDQTQRIASVGGWEMDLRGGPPFEGEFTDELYRIHELPVGTEMNLERGLEYYHPDYRDRVRSAVEHAIESGERYELEALFVTAEDNERWVRTTGIPIYEDGALVKLRGAVQDITEQKEWELALESLQETTRGLLGTETSADVAQLVVRNASEFLDTSGIAIYLLDNETNELEPAAVSDAFVDLCGQPTSVAIDRSDSALWDAFISGERTVVDAANAEGPRALCAEVEHGFVLSLDDYGVFVVATPKSALDDESSRLIETLVATTEAALDRLQSEALLRQRESELASRNRRLRRQIQINSIIRSIHTSLIGVDSRTEIEQTVCERLVDAEHIRFAWIGSLDADETALNVRAWDGTGQEYLDERPLTVEDSDEPAAVTARTGEPTVVRNVVSELSGEDWRQRAALRDFYSVVSVPLAFDEFSVGVLTVYADEPDAFSDLERTVFTELGESIVNTIVAVNTRQALHADTLVELTVGLESESFFTRVARETDCRIQYEGMAAHDSDESRLFFTAVGAESEAVLSTLEELVSVADARLVSAFEDECLFEVAVTEETIPVWLARHGGRLLSVQVDQETLEFVVDVPATTDVREFLGMLEEEYSGVELLSRRNVERSRQTRQGFLDYLFEELTDRQLEVLRTAYYAGFFEWPRTSTGEDIASMLDVTQPTVNRHLRLGQQRLMDVLFEHTAVDRE